MNFDPNDTLESRLYDIRCRMTLVLAAMELTQTTHVFNKRTNEHIEKAAYDLMEECIDALEEINHETPAEILDWTPRKEAADGPTRSGRCAMNVTTPVPVEPPRVEIIAVPHDELIAIAEALREMSDELERLVTARGGTFVPFMHWTPAGADDEPEAR